MKKRVLQNPIVPIEVIQNKIYLIRMHKVMLDKDLAELYGVPTKSLNLAVKRNLPRFPKDFMFCLTENEAKNLRFQIETSSWGGRRYLPNVFTQEGVAMLSSVLNSERAIHVNIQIMRTFAKLRELMISHKDLATKIEDIEKKFQEHDKKFVLIFEAIKQLFKEKVEPPKPKEPYGFHGPLSKNPVALKEAIKKHKLGYQRHPVEKGEFDGFE